MPYSPHPLIKAVHHVSRFGYVSNLSLVDSLKPSGESYSKGLGINGGIIVAVGILLFLLLAFGYFVLCCCPCCRSCKQGDGAEGAPRAPRRSRFLPL